MIYPIKITTTNTEYHLEVEASCFSEACDLVVGLSIGELSKRHHLKVATDSPIVDMRIYDITALEYTLGATYNPVDGVKTVNHVDRPSDKKYKDTSAKDIVGVMAFGDTGLASNAG